MKDTIWRLERGRGPLVATAIHDGHEVRSEVAAQLRIDDAARLREEDPLSGQWTEVTPTRVVGTRSRFEVDLNRPREKAVYLSPEDAWGLDVWARPPHDSVVSASLAEYDGFYAMMHELGSDLVRCHGRFVVLDLHTYNHRRDGPGGPEADPAANPQVNIGTGTILDRKPWAGLIDRFVNELGAYAFPGGGLDVRENVKFRGGNLGKFMHGAFPGAVCVLSVEVKKFFMDEWTGEADWNIHAEVGKALATTVPGLLEEVGRL